MGRDELCQKKHPSFGTLKRDAHFGPDRSSSRETSEYGDTWRDSEERYRSSLSNVLQPFCPLVLPWPELGPEELQDLQGRRRRVAAVRADDEASVPRQDLRKEGREARRRRARDTQGRERAWSLSSVPQRSEHALKMS